MKRQSAFLFIPLLFTFNPGTIDTVQDRLGFLNLSWQSRNAQMAPSFQSTTTGIDIEDSTDATTTSSSENPDGSATSSSGSAISNDSPDSTDTSASTSSDVSQTATNTITTTTETATPTPWLSNLIPPLIPLVPGTPNTGVFDTSTPEATSAPTSTNTGNVPSTLTPPNTQDEQDSNSNTNTPSNDDVIEEPSGRVFSTGAVTFRFDDGWSSQFSTALPILESAGITGTFYIVPSQTSDNGFTGFMSKAQIVELAARGAEIGAHTRTHPHLPTLSTRAQQQEVAGSKQDLESWGISAQSFSFPYGEYTADTVQIVKDAGFSSAVTTIERPASSDSDPFQIESPSVTSSQSSEEVIAMIDAAIEENQWLILAFHRIDYSGDAYSITPEEFKKVVDYVNSRDIPTVTVSQGAAQLK